MAIEIDVLLYLIRFPRHLQTNNRRYFAMPTINFTDSSQPCKAAVVRALPLSTTPASMVRGEGVGVEASLYARREVRRTKKYLQQ